MASQAKMDEVTPDDKPIYTLGQLELDWGDGNGGLPSLDAFIVRIDSKLLSYLAEVRSFLSVALKALGFSSLVLITLDADRKRYHGELTRRTPAQ